MLSRPTPMTDMELQNKCLLAGKEYADIQYPGYSDMQVKAQIQNACAAGYSKGYRDAQKEIAAQQAAAAEVGER